MDPQGTGLEMLSNLKTAVECMMDHSTSQKQRGEAYRLCEDFKESSPDCAQYGFMMVEKENSHIIRHFGLQLVEYAVRYKWNKMTAEQKVFIKDNTLKLMAEGTFDLLVEQCHIKDGLSRIMVEIIKREWPQQYPNMFNEFHKLCSLGPTQTELVLLIFLRLAEDVLLFQNVPQQRRRDILNGLSGHMSNVYSFFTNTLHEHFEEYQALKSSNSEEKKPALLASCKVCQVALEALSAYLDWISITYIFQNGGMILQLLCVLLNVDDLQLPAAECLIIIANRKGKLEDRKPLLILFSEDAMGAIFNAAVVASRADLEEYHYLFLKKLCQVLAALGTQLAALWGSTVDGEVVGQPPTFASYLDAMLSFTQHLSQRLGSISMTMWNLFLKHEHITKNSLFRDVYIPKLLQTTRQSLLKVGFPSQNNSRSCDYSRLDFDTDQDFSLFYTKYRTEVTDAIRQATLISPSVAFYFVESWLDEQLKKPVDIGKNCEKDLCNLSSPSFLEFDALTVCVECVMTRLGKSQLAEKLPVENGIAMLKSVLHYSTQDPLLLSSVLSCISALFPFLRHAPAILSEILDKIFAAAVFNIPGQTKATRSRAVRNVRRHACAVLVKVCKEYPEMLFPGFSQLYDYVKKLSEDPEELSQLEKTTLMEAIILISNEFKNYEKQEKFLGEILQPTKDIWLAGPLREALWSAEKFMTFVGLDQMSVDMTLDTCGLNRSQILYCINVIHSVKRSTWPSDPEVAKQGGFVLGNHVQAPEVNNGVASVSVMYRSPATSHVLLMVENVLALCRTLNQLWLPEFQQKKHVDFTKAYDLMDIEKQITLGTYAPSVDNTNSTTTKSPLERMQSFLTTIHDTCYQLLGSAGRCLGVEFYQAPNLATVLAQTVFTNLHAISDYRLRVIIRSFVKPFVVNCPKEYYGSVLLPVFQTIAPYMLERLASKWQIVSQQIEKSDDEEEPETEEVLQNLLLRQLSREHVELIVFIFKDKRSEVTNESSEMGELQAVEDSSQNSQAGFDIRELGKLVLMSEGVFPPLVMTVFSGLSWPDSQVCNKCVALCFPLMEKLVTDGKVTSDDITHMYSSVLQGLHVHGQHEGQQAMLLLLGLQLYEYLRPQFIEVHHVMLQVPGCSANGLQTFDDRLLKATAEKQIPEKRKKDMYKKLVQGIIGQNVGQQFKKEIHFKNLPPLMKASKPKPPTLLDLDTKDIGLCALFAPELEDM